MKSILGPCVFSKRLLWCQAGPGDGPGTSLQRQEEAVVLRGPVLHLLWLSSQSAGVARKAERPWVPRVFRTEEKGNTGTWGQDGPEMAWPKKGEGLGLVPTGGCHRAELRTCAGLCPPWPSRPRGSSSSSLLPSLVPRGPPAFLGNHGLKINSCHQTLGPGNRFNGDPVDSGLGLGQRVEGRAAEGPEPPIW